MRQVLLLVLSAAPAWSPATDAGELTGTPWARHTIDDSSRGADGVRIGDVNRDGRLDLVTGWEEGGVVRMYLNPGPAGAAERWPAVTVGRVSSPEDAVFADLDGDGVLDVVSSCEGRTRTMYVHWAPHENSSLLDPSAWTTEPIPAATNARSWMFSLPFHFDDAGGIDLCVSSKGEAAQIGVLRNPARSRDLAAWTYRPLYRAGWIMSLIAADLDDDGDDDILFSDRKGPTRGCKWLENPGDASGRDRDWPVHLIGGTDREVMFIAQARLTRDGRRNVIAPTRDDGILIFTQGSAADEWSLQTVPMPAGVGTGKAAAVSDVNRDGAMDVVLSCEHAAGLTGVFWLEQSDGLAPGAWTAREISGANDGTKFDRLELVDLDDDGDLDVITCEERDNLGVIWYENPTRTP